MSENLYMPLFLFSIVLLFNTAGKNRKRNLLFNALFGAFMALGDGTHMLPVKAEVRRAIAEIQPELPGVPEPAQATAV